MNNFCFQCTYKFKYIKAYGFRLILYAAGINHIPAAAAAAHNFPYKLKYIKADGFRLIYYAAGINHTPGAAAHNFPYRFKVCGTLYEVLW